MNPYRSNEVWKRTVSNHLLTAVLAIGQFACLIMMTERPAKAYVDPGSGLLTLQMLGASLAGGIFLIRQKIKSYARKLGTKPGDTADRIDDRKGSKRLLQTPIERRGA
jgi:hypothetical protein